MINQIPVPEVSESTWDMFEAHLDDDFPDTVKEEPLDFLCSEYDLPQELK